MARFSGWRVGADNIMDNDMELANTSGNRSAALTNSRHIKSVAETSKLPPAVAIVSPDVVRNYVHSKRVKNYLIGDTLGEGSFAKVKEAFHELVGEKVAMKIIDKRKAQQDPYVAKNFRREAKLLQMVRHPNILQLYEVIETDFNLYLITELCSGGELMNYIYKKQRLDEDETCKFMQQIVSAVDHLHKAGIIHRDLKVENMLLDSNMDVKIIDFGLSNEEYVEGENGQLHCSTQCGSPAYAAPELLGHKEYSKEVDIWSIGVNMYAMLTGCLPYTVEPFNITALHAKMLENKMNPIPNHLSVECKDLLRCLLRTNPIERITMEGIMAHPWMSRGSSLPFGPAPFPNKITSDEIAEEIVEHMVNTLNVRSTVDQLKQELLQNRATSITAVYSLLATRLARYLRDTRSRSSIRRKRTKSCSSSSRSRERDTNQDNPGVIVRPQRSRPSSRKISPGTKLNITPLASESKERSLSSPSVIEEIMTAVQAPTSISRSSRRKSVPPAILEKELAEFNARKGEEESLARKKQWHYQPRPNTSTLPEVRLRKKSAPSTPLDYMTRIDKEALQPQDTNSSTVVPVAHNSIVTRRRKTVPPMVLQKEIAEFRNQRKAKEGARRNHTSQAQQRPNTTHSTLPRISSLPKDAHLLPFEQQQQQKQHQFVVTQSDRYLKRTRSTPQDRYSAEYDDTEEAAVTLSPTRNCHTYPVGLSSLGDSHNPPPPKVTTAWQQTAKQTLSKTKSKIQRAFSGLTIRISPSDSGVDYDAEEGSGERGERIRKASPAGHDSGDTNHYLPALYSDSSRRGSPQKRVYGLSNR